MREHVEASLGALRREVAALARPVDVAHRGAEGALDPRPGLEPERLRRRPHHLRGRDLPPGADQVRREQVERRRVPLHHRGSKLVEAVGEARHAGVVHPEGVQEQVGPQAPRDLLLPADVLLLAVVAPEIGAPVPGLEAPRPQHDDLRRERRQRVVGVLPHPHGRPRRAAARLDAQARRGLRRVAQGFEPRLEVLPRERGERRQGIARLRPLAPPGDRGRGPPEVVAEPALGVCGQGRGRHPGHGLELRRPAGPPGLSASDDEAPAEVAPHAGAPRLPVAGLVGAGRRGEGIARGAMLPAEPRGPHTPLTDRGSARPRPPGCLGAVRLPPAAAGRDAQRAEPEQRPRGGLGDRLHLERVDRQRALVECSRILR